MVYLLRLRREYLMGCLCKQKVRRRLMHMAMVQQVLEMEPSGVLWQDMSHLSKRALYDAVAARGNG